jgi:hypothetical protein
MKNELISLGRETRLAERQSTDGIPFVGAGLSPRPNCPFHGCSQLHKSNSFLSVKIWNLIR